MRQRWIQEHSQTLNLLFQRERNPLLNRHLANLVRMGTVNPRCSHLPIVQAQFISPHSVPHCAQTTASPDSNAMEKQSCYVNSVLMTVCHQTPSDCTQWLHIYAKQHWGKDCTLWHTIVQRPYSWNPMLLSGHNPLGSRKTTVKQCPHRVGIEGYHDPWYQKLWRYQEAELHSPWPSPWYRCTPACLKTVGSTLSHSDVYTTFWTHPVNPSWLLFTSQVRQGSREQGAGCMTARVLPTSIPSICYWVIDSTEWMPSMCCALKDGLGTTGTLDGVNTENKSRQIQFF